MTVAGPTDTSRKRRAAKALALWQGLVLVGISMVTVLTIWHLKRRSRMIRARVRPQRFPDEPLADVRNGMTEPGVSKSDRT